MYYRLAGLLTPLLHIITDFSAVMYHGSTLSPEETWDTLTTGAWDTIIGGAWNTFTNIKGIYFMSYLAPWLHFLYNKSRWLKFINSLNLFVRKLIFQTIIGDENAWFLYLVLSSVVFTYFICKPTKLPWHRTNTAEYYAERETPTSESISEFKF